jgi:hypothetical protein
MKFSQIMTVIEHIAFIDAFQVIDLQFKQHLNPHSKSVIFPNFTSQQPISPQDLSNINSSLKATHINLKIKVVEILTKFDLLDSLKIVSFARKSSQHLYSTISLKFPTQLSTKD